MHAYGLFSFFPLISISSLFPDKFWICWIGRVLSGLSDRVGSHDDQITQTDNGIDGPTAPQEKRLLVYQLLAQNLSEQQRFQVKVVRHLLCLIIAPATKLVQLRIFVTV